MAKENTTTKANVMLKNRWSHHSDDPTKMGNLSRCFKNRWSHDSDDPTKIGNLSRCLRTALRTVPHWKLAHCDAFPLVSPKEEERWILQTKYAVLTLVGTVWIRSMYLQDTKEYLNQRGT